MRIMLSDLRRVATALLGLGLGALFALPAQAGFTPLSGPVLSSTAAPPNVVILFDNSSSMVLNRIEGDTRLSIAREAAKAVIRDNRDVRFGLFVFRDTEVSGNRINAPGGRLLVEVGDISPQSSAGEQRFHALESALDGINPSTRSSAYTYTPLAETYYEITRYLRGLRAYYPQSVPEARREQFSSPIEYRCQKNVGLVLTDGLPTYDSEFPDNLQIEPDIDNPAVPGAINLPNWDGDDAGDSTGEDISVEGSRFYLNDIARFAYDIDLRNTERHGVGHDVAGGSWDDPAFAKQNLRTYTVGFALNDPRLDSVAKAGGGRYYTAADRQQLTAALNSIVGEISAAPGAGGAGVASGPHLTSASLFYRTQYDPRDWSGVVEALGLNGSGQLEGQVWSSDASITSASTALYQTWRLPQGAVPGRVMPLDATTYAWLGTEQRYVLDRVAGEQGGQALLDWSRGEEVTGYRPRARLMGDMIHSPLVLADVSSTTISHQPLGYADYLRAKRVQMRAALLVGANDGFLHVLAASDGAHRLAFLPATAQPGLGARARPDYMQQGHVSGVDGPIVVSDAWVDNTWTTLALAGAGAGGKGLFAVRLFDQAAGNDALGALWEITPDSPGYAELGYSYGKPVIARLGGEWVAIAGNGYGGASGQAMLYVIRLSDGKLIRSLPAGGADAESGNGLSAPNVVLNAQGEVIAAYAGDLLGRLWKFDLNGAEPGGWGVDLGGAPLFTAGLPSNRLQPISVEPVLVSHPQGGQLVLFGTGKFLEPGDRLDTGVQAVYAVWDRPGGDGNLSVADLQPQAIVSESSDGQRRMRTVTQHRVNWGGAQGAGWYLPLVHADRALGERVTRNMVIRGGRVSFNTGFVLRSTDPCTRRGDGWLMSLDIFSGGMLRVATLDANGDGLIDETDLPLAGISLEGGLPGELVVLEQPRIQPAQAGSEWGLPEADEAAAPVRCDAATEFCPCDPAVDECSCALGDTGCRTIYCGREYNLSVTTTAVDRVVGAGHCRFNRILWRQLM